MMKMMKIENISLQEFGFSCLGRNSIFNIEKMNERL
jgi:hypothetical protein